MKWIIILPASIFSKRPSCLDPEESTKISKRSLETHYCGDDIYDPCRDLCCGGSLILQVPPDDLTRQCCGDAIHGMFFDATVSSCCETSHSFIHPELKINTTFITFDTPNLPCCHNGKSVPKTFDVTNEMCCDGHVNYSGDTAYTSCCKDVSFDRRFYSCPCGNGVLQKVPENDAKCCGSSNPYSVSKDLCCDDGTTGPLDTSICCGDTNILLTVPENSEKTIPKCCKNELSYQAFNEFTDYCCAGKVVKRSKEYPIEACCEHQNDEFYDASIYHCCENGIGRGDSCCNGNAIDSSYQLCCENNVYDKFVNNNLEKVYDSCCLDEPYLNTTKTCCDGVLSSSVDKNGKLLTECCGNMPINADTDTCCDNKKQGPFFWPACCKDMGYDAKYQTCCGDQIFDNPAVTDLSKGITYVSEHTRCCFNNIKGTWAVYDYIYESCCAADGISENQVGFIKRFNPENSDSKCCGDQEANSDQICCHILDTNTNSNKFRVHKLEFGTKTSCCGIEKVYNTETHICCDPNNGFLSDRYVLSPTSDDKIEMTACCNGIPYNSVDFICCGTTDTGKPDLRSLNGVDPTHAECCDSSCIDTRHYWCCGGKIYSKGSDLNADFTCPHDNSNKNCECSWTEWSSCSASCGNDGTRTRMKTLCYNSEDKICTDSAEFGIRDTTTCSEGSPTDCEMCMCSWTEWSGCSKTCGTGVRTRKFEDCRDPNGNVCQKNENIGIAEDISCTVGTCPDIIEDCECSWSEWSKCSTTCDPGRQTRTRTCSDDFSDKCLESSSKPGQKDGDVESIWCNKDNSCPGDWTEWGPWDKCSETCGGGQQQRMRFCSSGFPNLPGSSCLGESTQIQYCNFMPCEAQLCEDSYFDLCFLVEASSKTGDSFAEILQFVDSCQKHFPSEPNELNWRLCLSSFSCQTDNHWSLADTPSSFTDATTKINQVEHSIECGVEPDFQFAKSLETFVQSQLTDSSGRRLAKFDPQLGLIQVDK